MITDSVALALIAITGVVSFALGCLVGVLSAVGVG
jgi:hypothetical protein